MAQDQKALGRSKRVAAEPRERVKLPKSMGFMVRRLQQVFVANFHQSLEPLGMTPVQYTLLSIVGVNPGIEQVALAAEAALDPSTVADVLRRLTERGLVERQPGDLDKRKRTVTVTQKGKDLMAEAADPIRIARAELMTPLSAEEAEQFLSYIERLLAAHERGTAPWSRSLPAEKRPE